MFNNTHALCYTDIEHVLPFLMLLRASVTPKNHFQCWASISQVLVFVAYPPCDIHCVTRIHSTQGLLPVYAGQTQDNISLMSHYSS